MTRGARAWFEYRDDALVLVFQPQRRERFAHRRRMMGEIVNDGDAVNFSANLATAADALESRQRPGDGVALNSPRVSGNDYRQAVPHIEIADQGRLKLGPFFSLTKHTKASHPCRVRDVARLP